jgi:hypothetical protein
MSTTESPKIDLRICPTCAADAHSPMPVCKPDEAYACPVCFVEWSYGRLEQPPCAADIVELTNIIQEELQALTIAVNEIVTALYRPSWYQKIWWRLTK